MEENKVLNEVDEAVAEIDSTASMNDDKLKEAIEATLGRVRTQSMITGYRTACMTITQMIAPCFNQHLSYRDYERLIKQINTFCNKALEKQNNDENLAI